MTTSLQVTLHDIRRSSALQRRIAEKCAALERFHPHILKCHVSVARPGARTDSARPFMVTVRVAVPGREIVVDRSDRVDAFLAVREAFAATRRRLQDAARLARRDVKSHSLSQPEALDET